MYLLVLLAFVAAVLLDPIINEPRRLVSLIGLCAFLFILYAFSAHRSQIRWRPVIWGIILQFVMGLIILKWNVGRVAFRFASDQIVTFLAYTNNGTDFVFGFLSSPPPEWNQPGVFAFTILQVIIYFGAIVSVLYYFGVMQFVLTRLATFVQMTMGTTATESFNAVACIFLGQSEAPLMIRPYLPKMTESEIHAIMTSGFAVSHLNRLESIHIASSVSPAACLRRIFRLA